MSKIMNDADYERIMSRINSLMAKGSGHVSAEELKEIRTLALMVQDYEQSRYAVETPDSLIGMIEMRMFEMKLKQCDLAQRLSVSEAKLSLIMNGKQKPDIEFLKAIRQHLNIEADFILSHV